MRKNREYQQYHAVIEVYMEMKDGESKESAKQRMIDELEKTNVKYLIAHRDNIQNVQVEEW